MVLGIYGSGSLGNEILDLAIADGRWSDIIFIDDITTASIVNNIHICRYKDISEHRDNIEIIIATGEPYYRGLLLNKVRHDGLPLATLISSEAHLAFGSTVSAGSVIFPNTYIGVNATISENCIVHAGAMVESDCSIGANSFISLSAFIGADTQVGAESFIGPNAAVMDNIRVGDSVIVGMGAVVLDSIESEDVVVGNPARYLRKNHTKKLFGNSHVDETLTQRLSENDSLSVADRTSSDICQFQNGGGDSPH